MTQATQERKDSVSPEAIRELVDQFYERVRADDLLGPVFETHISDGWGPHLQKMYGFWETVLLGVSRYKGSPLATHAAIPGLTENHFERWLAIFAGIARRTLPPDAAERASLQAMGMAAGMSRRLQLKRTATDSA